MQETDLLSCNFNAHGGEAGDVAARPVEAWNEAWTGPASVLKTIGIVVVNRRAQEFGCKDLETRRDQEWLRRAELFLHFLSGLRRRTPHDPAAGTRFRYRTSCRKNPGRWPGLRATSLNSRIERCNVRVRHLGGAVMPTAMKDLPKVTDQTNRYRNA